MFLTESWYLVAAVVLDPLQWWVLQLLHRLQGALLQRSDLLQTTAEL